MSLLESGHAIANSGLGYDQPRIGWIEAIQLGLLPRMYIRRTSETERGQIYIPVINWSLLVAVIFLVVTFKSSSALASAYGIAVTGTMVVTVALATVVARFYWRWPWWRVGLVLAPFMVIDPAPENAPTLM